MLYTNKTIERKRDRRIKLNATPCLALSNVCECVCVYECSLLMFVCLSASFCLLACLFVSCCVFIFMIARGHVCVRDKFCNTSVNSTKMIIHVWSP